MLAYHVDLGVSMWSKDMLIDYVSRLRELGYTHILLEMQDKFRFDAHPALAHPDALPASVWREVVSVWRAAGMEIIPLWQTLGHAGLILENPAYAHLREQPSTRDQFCPGSPVVQKLLLEWIDELIEVFRPSGFFHIGGDETWNLGKSGRLQPLVQKIGVGGLYAHHMKPIFAHLIQKGLRPVIWADMLLTHPEILPKVPPEVVMMDWDYSTGTDRPSRIRPWGMHLNWFSDVASMPAGHARDLVEKYGVDEQTKADGTFRTLFYAEALADMGFDVITASANRCWGDSAGTPSGEFHLPNVFSSARKGKTHLGNTVTSWAVRHHHPETHWPITAVAAMAWHADEPFDIKTLLNRFCREHYGIAEPGYAEAILAAGRTWPSAQPAAQPARLEAFAAGRDPFGPDWKDLAPDEGEREAARDRLLALRSDAAAARARLVSLAERVSRHAAELEFWLEGIDYNLFHMDCLLAALAGMTSERRSALISRLDACLENTRGLFSQVYAPASVTTELVVRYGFFDVWLNDGVDKPST